jgi:hypothetical protein
VRVSVIYPHRAGLFGGNTDDDTMHPVTWTPSAVNIKAQSFIGRVLLQA